MQLALVTPRYPPTHAGGGEISARLLAEQLTERSIADVTVYSFDGETEETIGGVRVHRLTDLPQYPYTLPNEIAYRKLRAVDPDCDLFHAYNMHLHPAVGPPFGTAEYARRRHAERIPSSTGARSGSPHLSSGNFTNVPCSGWNGRV